MAVNFSVDATRGTTYSFWPEEFIISPELNGRHELPDITSLINDIESKGQIQPVLIRKDGGKPVLVCGFSRWRAIVDINKRAETKRKVVCVYEELTEQEAFMRNVAENKFRKETTEIDDAHNIKRMLNVYKMSEEEIALTYFPEATSDDKKKDAIKWVKKRVALIGLTKEAETAVRQGRIKPTAAKEIAKLSAAQQKEIVSGEGKIKGADVRKVSGKKSAPSLSQRIQQLQFVIVAIGEGAKASLVAGDTKEAFHSFVCSCDKPWNQCDTPDVRRDAAGIDDLANWEKDESGQRFAIHWRNETGTISIYRLSN